MTTGVVTVVVFGFVSVSIRLGGGGSGWPLHDALHPVLGLFFGPVYGLLTSVVGAVISEIVTPYTALQGMSPVLGGVAALTSGLMVAERRGWKVLWGTICGLTVVYLGIARMHGIPILVWTGHVCPVIVALLLSGLPQVRTWWSDVLSERWSWKIPVALYVIFFVASSFGILPVWVIGMIVDPFPLDIWEEVLPVVLFERGAFPLAGMLIAAALWPALNRKPLSVANQLRYGLPLVVLLTFLLAGRILVGRAYVNAQNRTAERLRDESRTGARALAMYVGDVGARLRRQSSDLAGPSRRDDLRWIESVADTVRLSTEYPERVRSVIRGVRTTGRMQTGYVSIPERDAHGLVVAVRPSSSLGASSARDTNRVAVACIRPHALKRTLSIWDETPSRVYAITDQGVPIRSAAKTDTIPRAFLESLLNASDSTVEAAQGRYGPDVLGAVATRSGLPGAVIAERSREEAYFDIHEMLIPLTLLVFASGGGALAIGFFLSRRVVAPLDRLMNATRRIGGGDLSTRVSVSQDNELGALAEAFNRMARDLADSVERLQQNEERLRIALDAARMGSWYWSGDTDSVTWSPQLYALLGVPRIRTDNLLPAYLARVHPEDREQLIRRMEVILRQETEFEIEHRIRPSRGKVRWVKVKGRVFRTDRGPSRVSGIVMDVTERKRTERELVAAKEEAEEMSRLKSAFLANVSHEIRTPLTSIIGFAEILVDDVAPAQQEVVEKIIRSSRRLKHTLDSVLDLSMIEAGEFSLNERTFDLSREVRQRAELLRPMADRKGLDFVVETPTTGPEVSLDPNAIDRILTNLVTNAVKFTKEGRVEVHVQSAPSHVLLQVRDTGIGIDDEFLPELFDAFKQESQGLQREHEGTGLGLSITKELVSLMGGRISVTSEKGQGSTFTVRLPYQLPPSS